MAFGQKRPKFIKDLLITGTFNNIAKVKCLNNRLICLNNGVV